MSYDLDADLRRLGVIGGHLATTETDRHPDLVATRDAITARIRDAFARVEGERGEARSAVSAYQPLAKRAAVLAGVRADIVGAREISFALDYAEELQRDLAAAREEVARLREALDHFGRHEDGCLAPGDKACTCGLEAILDATGAAPAQPADDGAICAHRGQRRHCAPPPYTDEPAGEGHDE